MPGVPIKPLPDSGNQHIYCHVATEKPWVLPVLLSEEYDLIPLPLCTEDKIPKLVRERGITFTNAIHHGRTWALEGIDSGHQ